MEKMKFDDDFGRLIRFEHPMCRCALMYKPIRSIEMITKKLAKIGNDQFN